MPPWLSAYDKSTSFPRKNDRARQHWKDITKVSGNFGKSIVSHYVCKQYKKNTHGASRLIKTQTFFHIDRLNNAFIGTTETELNGMLIAHKSIEFVLCLYVYARIY